VLTLYWPKQETVHMKSHIQIMPMNGDEIDTLNMVTGNQPVHNNSTYRTVEPHVTIQPCAWFWDHWNTWHSERCSVTCSWFSAIANVHTLMFGCVKHYATPNAKWMLPSPCSKKEYHSKMLYNVSDAAWALVRWHQEYDNPTNWWKERLRKRWCQTNAIPDVNIWKPLHKIIGSELHTCGTDGRQQ